MAYSDNNLEGKESEWNEANFKSRRLDEIQSLMNELKMNLLGTTENQWNYELYAKGIFSLMGEGRSKYSPKEKKEVDKIKSIVEGLLEYKKPNIPIIISTIRGSKESSRFNKENYQVLSKILYDFEMLVRDYNDAHGLTTRNKDMSEGLF